MFKPGQPTAHKHRPAQVVQENTEENWLSLENEVDRHINMVT